MKKDNVMKIKSKRFFLSIILIWLSGCAAIGVPYSSDPIEKLKSACILFDHDERPLPAEDLIYEAIEICQKTNDTECLAQAFLTNGLFFRSLSLTGRYKNHYVKRGFDDKAVTYETRLAKSDEYFERALALKPKNPKISEIIDKVKRGQSPEGTGRRCFN